MKIKNGKDYKAVEKIDGLYGVYGTGGLISRTDYYLINKPTVCIGRKGTIDKPLYFDQPIWTVDTLFYSDIFREYFPLFIYYLFLTIKWQNYNQSTGVPSLTSSAIEQIRIYVPYSKKEQEKIASLLFCLDKKIEIITSKTQALKKYKEGIVNWWFSNTGNMKKLADLVSQKTSQLLTNQIKENSGIFPVYDASGKVYKYVDFFRNDCDSIAIIKYGSGCGRTFIARGKHNVLGTMTEMVPLNPNDLLYIEAYTSSCKFKSICKKYAEIGTTPNLYFSDYSSSLVFYPKDRTKFTSLLFSFDVLESNLNEQLSLLEKVKNHLLRNMFI